LTRTVFRDYAIEQLRERLLNIYHRSSPPEPGAFGELVAEANQALLQEDPARRPYDRRNRPGGLVLLQEDTTTLIVPDLHARLDFFLSVLFYQDRSGRSNLEKLDIGEIQVVCVGDGVHAESRAMQRWRQALQEYEGDFASHTAMDEELRESFGLMEMVMEAKLAFPNHFHFLKGNHENITNETGNGNFSFGKLVLEGAMTAAYTRRFYGEKFLEIYAAFEKNLPLLAVGERFLISHSEPFTYYGRESVVNYRDHPEIVQGLTWTDNDMAEEGSIERMLAAYLDQATFGHGHYFSGHRAIKGRYKYRPASGFVQLHNPDLPILAVIKKGEAIDVEIDVIETKVTLPE